MRVRPLQPPKRATDSKTYDQTQDFVQPKSEQRESERRTRAEDLRREEEHRKEEERGRLRTQ